MEQTTLIFAAAAAVKEGDAPSRDLFPDRKLARRGTSDRCFETVLDMEAVRIWIEMATKGPSIRACGFCPFATCQRREGDVTPNFVPGARSLAPHIAMHEAALEFDLVEVDYQTRRTDTGTERSRDNSEGHRPAPAACRWRRTDRSSCNHSARGWRSTRCGAAAWLRHSASAGIGMVELHRGGDPQMLQPTSSTDDTGRLSSTRQNTPARQAGLCRALPIQANLMMDDDFSLADLYLFTVCRWPADQVVSLADWPALQRHSARTWGRHSIARRPWPGKA